MDHLIYWMLFGKLCQIISTTYKDWLLMTMMMWWQDYQADTGKY